MLHSNFCAEGDVEVPLRFAGYLAQRLQASLVSMVGLNLLLHRSAPPGRSLKYQFIGSHRYYAVLPAETLSQLTTKRVATYQRTWPEYLTEA